MLITDISNLKSYICKYSILIKMILGLFLTICCNLSIEGHIWPDDILPYIFLVLCEFTAFTVKSDMITEKFVKKAWGGARASFWNNYNSIIFI